MAFNVADTVQYNDYDGYEFVFGHDCEGCVTGDASTKLYSENMNAITINPFFWRNSNCDYDGYDKRSSFTHEKYVLNYS